MSKLPTWLERVAKGYDFMLPSKTISAIKNVGKNHEIGNKNHKKIVDINISATTEARAGHVLRPLSKNPTTKNVKKNPTSEQWRQKAHVSNEVDQATRELKEFFIHSSAKNLIRVQPGNK
jgi:hypothetical protein